MAKRHEEERDLRSVSKIAKVHQGQKVIEISKSQLVGIKMWGKLDYLTKYKGWYLVFTNAAAKTQSSDSNKNSARIEKKMKKEHQLKDKR
jgi:hypothetical protein